MAGWTVEGVELRGVVAAVPGAPVDVRAYSGPFPEAEFDRARKAVGLDRVHRVAEGTTTGDLNVGAARRLLDRLGWAPSSVDILISVTQTPDRFLPGNAYLAHQALGCRTDTMAFDIALGCSGFTYAAATASRLLGGPARRALILAGDTISRILDPSDKGTCLLFGDAGSAVALEAGVEGARLSVDLGADGGGSAALRADGGGFRDGASSSSRVATLAMDGIAVFAFTNREVPRTIRAVAATHGWELAEVEAFLLHQANAMVSAAVAKKLALPAERFPGNIGRYGNTSVASIPLLLADPLALPEAGRRAHKIILSGFGVGFSWASLACTLPAGFVSEIIHHPAEAA